MSFTILSLVTLGGGSVSSIFGLPQYQNVTPGAQVVEDIPLPQDYHGVPDR